MSRVRQFLVAARSALRVVSPLGWTVLVLGIVTAVGGGTLRDLLLNDIPPFSLKDENYIYIAIVVSLVVFANNKKFKAFEKPLLYFDAIGLGTFVVIGTTKALDFQLGLLGAVLMGVMTGTAGGVIRDIMANQVPLILRREIYASACVAGGTLLVILEQFNTARPIAAHDRGRGSGRGNASHLPEPDARGRHAASRRPHSGGGRRR